MPLKFGGGPKCKKCGKTVYKAEEVVSEAGIYHKLCFRCSSCNKVSLDFFEPPDGGFESRSRQFFLLQIYRAWIRFQ